MKKTTILVLSIFSPLLVLSQYLHFAKAFESTGKQPFIGYTAVLSIGVDGNRNIYTTGVVSDTVDFDPGIGMQKVNGYYNDIYISKLDSLGNYVWVKQIKGASVDESANLFVNSDGSFFFSGSTDVGADLDPGSGIHINTKKGFISKFDSQGNFLWAKEIDCFAGKIKGDVWGNIYITGEFSDTVDFDPGIGVTNLISPGKQDVFVMKLDSLGNYIWAKKFNSILDHDITNFVIDDQGNLYLTGNFQGQFDADPDNGTYFLNSQNKKDVFVVKLDSAGILSWAKNMAVDTNNSSYPVAQCGVDLNGNVYVCGSFSGTVDFDLGSSIYNVTSASAYDAYYLKLDASGNFVWVKTITSASINDINVNKNGTLVSSGTFNSIVDFDPNPLTTTFLDATLGSRFIHTIDSAGSLVWVKQLDLTQTFVSDIAVDNFQNIYLTGIGTGTQNWDPGISNYSTTLPLISLFVTKYSSTPVTILNTSEVKTKKLNVYPNPVENTLHIQTENTSRKGEVHLYDIKGTDLTSIIRITNGQQKQILDLSKLPSGTYILSVGVQRSVIVKR